MRKSYVVCAVLLVLSLLAGLTLSAVAAAPIDDVEVTLQVVDGDPSAAEGLVLSVVHIYENLFWKTRVELGGEPAVRSDFRQDEDNYLTGNDSVAWLSQPLGEDDNWLLWEQEEEQSRDLQDREMYVQDATITEERREQIVDELAAQMGPNETQTFELWLKDYADYYGDHVKNSNYLWYYSELVGYADDLIRRPVEDFCIAVTLTTNGQGGLQSVNWEDGYYYEYYGAPTTGAADGQGAFGLNAVWLQSSGTEGGTFLAIDMPQELWAQATGDWFPRGYGIFYVPWRYESFKNNYTVYINGVETHGIELPRYDEMEPVLLLPWDRGRVLAMSATPDGRCLQAVIRDGEELQLVSIADDDRQILSRLTLPAELADSENFTLLCREDFLVLCGDGAPFAVYTLDADGAATWQFTAVNPYITDEGWHGYWNPRSTYAGVDLAYCDGKLAVCGDLPWVQVYDETGLLFTGAYHLSLNQNADYGAGLYSYYSGNNRDSSVSAQLRWQK